MQNEKVQKWVNSLPVEHGEVEHGNTTADDGHLLHSSSSGSSSGRIADDMSLGAEANSVQTMGNGRGRSLTEGQNEDSAFGVLEPGARFRLMGRACHDSGDAAVQLLRDRFRIQQQDSFNSESSHLTIDSIDQLLWERREDPVRILENLGFVGKIVDRRRRIPERFLDYLSKANGISVEKFLKRNPWLKEYLDQKAALKKSFEATMNNNSESFEQTAQIRSELFENLPDKKLTAFHQVASTVTMINRFRNFVRRLKAKDPEPEPLVEPVLRNSIRGPKYWSILSLDNYSFLDRLGYYEMCFGKPSKMGHSKFNLAANAVRHTSANALMNKNSEAAVKDDDDDDELQVKQSKELDTILSSRSTVATEKGKETMEKGPGKKIESPMVLDDRFSIPERFLAGQSLLFGPVQQLTGESVFKLVHRGNESISGLSPGLDWRFPSSNDFALSDSKNANAVKDIPAIVVQRSFCDSVSTESNADAESFEYEWQGTGASSPEDSSFSDSDDRAFAFDRPDYPPGMDVLDLTPDDVGRGLLGIPSDAVSDLSSHTIRELESVDHSSDQDTCVDTLQISSDSLLTRRDNIRIDPVNSSDTSADQRGDIHDISSQFDKQTILGDQPPSAVNFSSKIRVVLRRQGSSQSDSSGFIDSDHLDSSLLPDTYFPNKARHVSRSIKLDTISSQESVSLDEDSPFSSQSNFFRSSHSIFIPPVDQNFCGKPANQIRLLKGDYQNEFWSAKHSVETQTGWDCLRNSHRENSSSLCDGLSAESKTSMRERFLCQPELHTTRLCIDSLLSRTSVPLIKRSEVMLIVDGNNGASRSPEECEDSQLRSAYHVSSVDVDVIKTKDGDQFLAPILFSSGSTATVRSQTLDERRLFDKKEQIVDLELADEDSFTGTLPLQTDVFDSSLKANFTQGKSLPFDTLDHQILHSLLRDSAFVSPQCAAALLPPSHWSMLGDAEVSQKHHLLEEVKLLQQALQKYRLEVRVLQMQAKNLYIDETSLEERDSLLVMEELHEAIAKELDSLDGLLLQKMKMIVSLSPQELSRDVDLSCLSIVKQMTDLLKEQINHGNIISGMSVILTSRSVSSAAANIQNSSERNLLRDKIALLKRRMEERSTLFEKCLSSATKQMQEMTQHKQHS